MASRRQRATGIVFIVFFLVLGSLTLLSNTIQTAMLPKVTTEQPVSKALTFTIQGSGIITPRQATELMNESGWKVAHVHVSEQERVEKDQPLITFDSSDAQQMLLDEEGRLRKMKLQQEALEEQYMTAYRSGDEEAILNIERSLQSGQIDLDIQQRRIDQLRKDLADNRSLKAPYAGIVSNLKAVDGISSFPGQPLLELIKMDEGFHFSFNIDEASASRLEIHEKVTVEVKGEEKETMEGIITEIKDAESGSGGTNAERLKTVVVQVNGDGLQGGERASIHVEAQAEEQGVVIRKERVKKDERGSYVLVIRENRSSLGNTYTVHKRYVRTGDENDEEIIILEGLSVYDDIVAETSVPLQDGNRIRLD